MPPKSNGSRRRLSPRSFKYFLKLASELREIIFIIALPDGQSIAVKEEWHIVNYMKCIAKEATAWYKIPALLYTSQEAHRATQ